MATNRKTEIAAIKIQKAVGAMAASRQAFEAGIMEMRAAGATFDEIATASGFTDTGVFHIVKRAEATTAKPKAKPAKKAPTKRGLAKARR
jgi:hypothetical protein